jgi:hypothetical protein
MHVQLNIIIIITVKNILSVTELSVPRHDQPCLSLVGLSFPSPNILDASLASLLFLSFMQRVGYQV